MTIVDADRVHSNHRLARGPTLPPSGSVLFDVIDELAQRTPGFTAVISTARTLCYGEVARLSDALARELRTRGVGPSVLVAITMRRGWEQVVATIGALKAGAAYLPIDPSLPADR